MRTIKALSTLAAPILAAAASATFSEVSAQETSPVNYYLRASEYYADLTNPEYSKPFWSLSESEQVTPDDLPGSNAAIIIDRTNYVEDTGGYIANARGGFREARKIGRQIYCKKKAVPVQGTAFFGAWKGRIFCFILDFKRQICAKMRWG